MPAIQFIKKYLLYRTPICLTSDRNPHHPPYVFFLQQDLLSTCNQFRDYFRVVILEGAKYRGLF